MKFTLRFKKINGLLYFFMISFFVFSCGSYQYVGIYEDGIYSDDDSSNQNSSLNTNDYYTDYFKGKLLNMNQMISSPTLKVTLEITTTQKTFILKMLVGVKIMTLML